MTAPVAPEEAGVTAGFASRSVAMVIDVIVIAATFYGGLAIVALTVQVLRLRHLDPGAVPTRVVPFAFAGWTVLYFWAAWWTFGKTLGKAILGLRVVRDDGSRVTWSRALARLGGYGLSVLALGVGFAWVAIDRRRRAWQDIVAGTRVVYDWEPHAAHLDGHVDDRESPSVMAGSSDGGDDLRPVSP